MSLREPVIDAILATAAAEDMDALPRQELSALTHPDLEAQLAAHLSEGLGRPGSCGDLPARAGGPVPEPGGGPTVGNSRPVLGALARPAPAWPRSPLWVMTRRWRSWRLLPASAPPMTPAMTCWPQSSKYFSPGSSTRLRSWHSCAPSGIPTTSGHISSCSPMPSALIPEDELPAALSWASEHAADGNNAYGDLLPALLNRGWNNVAAPGVREPLARLVAAMATSPDRIWRHGHVQHPWRNSPPGPRRKLAVRVAACLPTDNYFPLIDLGLLLFSDLGWLLEVLPSLARPEQDALARCVSSLVRQPTAARADLILGMTDDHPAYAHTRWLRNERAQHRLAGGAASTGRRPASRR